MGIEGKSYLREDTCPSVLDNAIHEHVMPLPLYTWMKWKL